MHQPIYIRSNNKELAVWQSVVARYLQKKLSVKNSDLALSDPAIRNHPMMQAVYRHIDALDKGRKILAPACNDDSEGLHTYLSQQFFELARAKFKKDEKAIGYLTETTRPFSDGDISAWILAVLEWLEAYADGTEMYNAYTDPPPNGGGGDLNWGIIDYTLPKNAKVAIIGDWATGMDDAVSLLKSIMTDLEPDAIIHLGDIYYAGTVQECQSYVIDVFSKIFSDPDVNKSIPVFSIPGNHDYYTLGTGFYSLVLNINNELSVPLGESTNYYMQPASFFCLRTEDNAWQFLGMDTGYDFNTPLHVATSVHGPALNTSEVKWHQDKLDNFNGNTILLSHHQLYSANAPINGPLVKGTDYLNDNLLAIFQPYFDKIAAWFWGHEHNLVLFEDGLYGLMKGRLVGCSGYEEESSEHPYKVKYPIIAYNQPPIELSQENAYYNHACALIDFSTAEPTTTYYEYPSWYPTAPENPKLTQLFQETLSTNNPYVVGYDIPLPNVGSDEIVNIQVSNGTVYAGAQGMLFAIDKTGQVTATSPLVEGAGQEVRMLLSDDESTLYVGTAGTVLALSTSDLSINWQTNRPSTSSSIVNILLTESNLYAGSYGYVYQLDLSGNIVNSNGLSDRGYHEIRLATDGNLLYLGTDGYALALSLSDLSTQWQTSLPRTLDTLVSVLCANSYIYAGSYGHVFQLNNSGDILQNNGLPDRGNHEIRFEMFNTTLLVGTDGYAIGLDPLSLKTLWQTSLPSTLDNIVNFAVTSDNIYPASDGSVFKLDANGNILINYDGHGNEIHPQIDGNALYLGIQSDLALGASTVKCVNASSLT